MILLVLCLILPLLLPFGLLAASWHRRHRAIRSARRDTNRARFERLLARARFERECRRYGFRPLDSEQSE